MIEVVDSLAEARAVLRRGPAPTALVATMGALHAGHQSLITAARARAAQVAVTVFVNPLQFNNPEDLARYPRTLEADVAACAEAGADLVIAPSVEDVYPTWPELPPTEVHVGPLGSVLEGASRPGHFNGMATVVVALLAALQPDLALFGEKDLQQLAIVRQVVRDLHLPVEIVGVATSREPDGLARSSRNVRLSPEAREAATALWQALRRAQARLDREPQVRGVDLEAEMAAVLLNAGPLVEPDYAVALDAETLAPHPGPVGTAKVALAVAAVVGGVRLIDNLADATASQA